MRPALRNLKNGHVMAILPDTRMREREIDVPLLNGTANLGRGMALFARLADVPILPRVVTREGWARHRIVMHDPVWPDKTLDKKTDIERMTRTVVKILDAAIREQPEQWFWFNKRWVLDPVDA